MKYIIIAMSFYYIITLFIYGDKLHATEIPTNGIENNSDVVSLDLAKSMIDSFFLKNIPKWNRDLKMEISEIKNEEIWRNFRYQLFIITKHEVYPNDVFMINKKEIICLGHVKSLVLYDVDNDGHLDIIYSESTGSGGMVCFLTYFNVFKRIESRENNDNISNYSFYGVIIGITEYHISINKINNRIYFYEDFFDYDENNASRIDSLPEEKKIGELVFDREPILTPRIIFQDNIDETQRKRYRIDPRKYFANLSLAPSTNDDHNSDMSSTKIKESTVPEKVDKTESNSDIPKTGNTKSKDSYSLQIYAIVAVLIMIVLIPVVIFVRKKNR